MAKSPQQQYREVQMRDAVNVVLAGQLSSMASKDANEALSFVVGQLTYTEANLYARKRQDLQYKQFIPVSTEVGEFATAVRYEMYDYAGRGKRSSGRGGDINKVDVSFGEKTMPIYLGDIGYDYTQEELRQSAFLRKSLPEARSNAAFDAYDRHLNDVGLYGERDLTGLFNNPFVPVCTPLYGDWASKTPAEILKDINDMIQQVWVQSNYVEMPSMILLPPKCMTVLASTPRSEASDKTILQYVQENNIAKLERSIDIEIRSAYGLDTAGAGGTARALVYTKSPDKLVMHVPMPIRFLAPQPRGLLVEIAGEYKYGGVEFRYPGSAVYFDGL
ncbi:MAG: DUF2184 domain-containing protein [Betaproteobacteria bacterium]|nr:DUF2184 domain-containing protein [Betaproteobacteria bacterium]